MDFSVPQFIEKSPKIIGPFTLKQFMYIGTAIGLALILYFSIDFVYFVLFSIILLGAAFGLAFVNINGAPLPTVLKNFLFFSIAPRIYIWKKAEIPLFKRTVENKILKKTTDEESATPTLQIEANGRLKKLRSDLELKI
jgi:hypothetical protein